MDKEHTVYQWPEMATLARRFAQHCIAVNCVLHSNATYVLDAIEDAEFSEQYWLHTCLTSTDDEVEDDEEEEEEEEEEDDDDEDLSI